MRMIIALCIVVLTCQNLGWASGDAQSDAARGVLTRLIGERAKSFELSSIPKEGTLDVFELEARDGLVRVRGSSGVAICRGAYEYLKDSCNCLVTWDGDQLALPAKFPDAPLRRIVCPNQYRHYFNVCTFGYTMAFWDWERWQREIDWMALHGINMPLAMTGQEKTWLKVWMEMGLTNEQVRGFFSGPAFLPWHRMGNLNSHCGPLPQHWIDAQAELQKQILNRERELGMTPVTPAFSGFLPPDFVKAHSELRVIRSSSWCGFEPTYLLDARDPMFAKIGKRFIDAYREEFGAGEHLYLADLFNEMTPTVSKETRLEDLKAISKGVIDTMCAADPDSIWVMQGWLFHNEPSFWKILEVDAFLGAVPNDRMIILDLACEEDEMWRKHAAIRQKKYIWCLLHNYGQNTALFGDLPKNASKPFKALNDPNRGGMAGMGLTMEGIEQNSVVYEMMCDAMWRTEPIDVDQWIAKWARERYGADSKEAVEIWGQMLDIFYSGKNSAWTHPLYQHRPSLNAIGEPGDRFDDLQRLTHTMLEAPEALHHSAPFRRDLVDVVKTLAGIAVDAELYIYAIAVDENKTVPMLECQRRVREVLEVTDALLENIPSYRLTGWIALAAAWGGDDVEKSLMEKNARAQVTVWDWNSALTDYAAKQWSGLVRDFYLPRWERLFVTLQEKRETPIGFSREIESWENAWTSEAGVSKPEAQDPFACAAELLKICTSTQIGAARIDTAIDRGIAVGKPVTSSGNTEGEHVPSIITDGKASGRYWAAADYPQWVQIDLEKPMKIDRVQVFPFADGSRYYQYKVEISMDCERWKLVADETANKRPASRRGTMHKFDATEARYVRVTMTFNSANPSVHLHEMRVFGAR